MLDAPSALLPQLLSHQGERHALPYSVSVPPFKYSTMVANLGAMRNKGLEISVGGTPISTPDMGLTINGNITFQNNKLLSLNGYYKGEYLTVAQSQGIAAVNGAGFHGGDNDVTYQIVGQPLGSFLLPHCTGLAGSQQETATPTTSKTTTTTAKGRRSTGRCADKPCPRCSWAPTSRSATRTSTSPCR